MDMIKIKAIREKANILRAETVKKCKLDSLPPRLPQSLLDTQDLIIELIDLVDPLKS